MHGLLTINIDVSEHGEHGEPFLISLLELFDRNTELMRVWDDRFSPSSHRASVIFYELDYREGHGVTMATSFPASVLQDEFARYAIEHGLLVGEGNYRDGGLVVIDVDRFTTEDVVRIVRETVFGERDVGS